MNINITLSEALERASEGLRKKMLHSVELLQKAEKLERINSLRKNGSKVKGESMKDSLYDLANYAILTIMELEKTEK